MAELELARLRDELIPVAQILPAFEGAAEITRTRLMRVPSKLAPRVASCRDSIDAEELIREEIAEALAELSRLPCRGYRTGR